MNTFVELPATVAQSVEVTEDTLIVDLQNGRAISVPLTRKKVADDE
jgi:antitoxin component of MazEF toxin-antitoxin module